MHFDTHFPYARSASIHLTRRKKHGNELSLLFCMILYALICALKATGVGHRTISNLQTSALCVVDNLVLVVCSAAGLQCLLAVVFKFCKSLNGLGMLIKLDKSAITASDHRTHRKVYTDEIL